MREPGAGVRACVDGSRERRKEKEGERGKRKREKEEEKKKEREREKRKRKRKGAPVRFAATVASRSWRRREATRTRNEEYRKKIRW